MAARGGDTRAKAEANGKKVGRPQKPRIEGKVTHAIATEVLAMDGPPDHERKCECRACEEHRKSRCKCLKVHDQPLPDACKTAGEHKVCHCEICRWWSHRLSTDKRIRYDADVYLTNQRDGKPAEKIEGSFDPDKPFVLTIEHIGRNPRKAASPAAQAK